MQRKKANPPDGKCQTKNKAGKPCRAHAVRGKCYCSVHLDPNHAAELGRKGGQKNRSQNPSGILYEPLPVPQNASDVLQMLRKACALTYAGRMSSSQATSLASLANTTFKGQTVVELEARVALLEKRQREKLENSLVDSAAQLPDLDDPDSAEREGTVKPRKPS